MMTFEIVDKDFDESDCHYTYDVRSDFEISVGEQIMQWYYDNKIFDVTSEFDFNDVAAMFWAEKLS